MHMGINTFLKEVDLTFRRDPHNPTPRQMSVPAITSRAVRASRPGPRDSRRAGQDGQWARGCQASHRQIIARSLSGGKGVAVRTPAGAVHGGSAGGGVVALLAGVGVQDGAGLEIAATAAEVEDRLVGRLDSFGKARGYGQHRHGISTAFRLYCSSATTTTG